MERDLVVTPQAWSHRGEATLIVRGREMHVWQGIVGEPEHVRILGGGAHRDYAVFRDAISPSPYRVDPECGRYHACGGCPMMHLNLDGQHEAKRELAAAALAERGMEHVEVGPVVVGPDPKRNFRHVVKLGVGYSDRGHLRVGAWGRNDRSIVPIPHCTVATDSLRQTMASVAHHIIGLDIHPYDPQTGEGILRSVILRQSRASGDVLVTLIAGRWHPRLADLSEAVSSETSAVAGVALHLNDEFGNAIFSFDADGEARVRPIGGRPYLYEEIDGVKLRVDPTTFFQTNPGLAERLYLRALELMALDDTTPLIDLYCGVGPIALLGSRRTGWAHGIDISQASVAAARQSAKEQGLAATFEAGHVADLLPDLAARYAASRPVVAVNPARRGLENDVIEGIVALHPRRIAYISCNPRSLARDLARFAEYGFHTERVELFDMFPHTVHVESLVLLTSDDPTEPAQRVPRRSRLSQRKPGGSDT